MKIKNSPKLVDGIFRERKNKIIRIAKLKKESERPEQKILKEIIALREQLGLPTDQSWHSYIDAVTISERQEILKGLQELAQILNSNISRRFKFARFNF